MQDCRYTSYSLYSYLVCVGLVFSFLEKNKKTLLFIMLFPPQRCSHEDCLRLRLVPAPLRAVPVLQPTLAPPTSSGQTRNKTPAALQQVSEKTRCDTSLSIHIICTYFFYIFLLLFHHISILLNDTAVYTFCDRNQLYAFPSLDFENKMFRVDQ